MTLAERFGRYAIKSDGCWEWSGSLDKDGYGVIGAYPTQGKNIRASHASWLLHRGTIPANMRLCHRCDNPPCVNPDHLFLGTDADNHADSARKGRRSFGERNNKAKLTTEQVVEIKRMCAAGKTRAEISRQFDITATAVQYIAIGRTWKHVQGL